MANIISRGFGALQRIITRGFFSGAAITPECFVPFIGTITDTSLGPVAFIGTITDTTGFIGTITDPNLIFIGTITDTTVFIGDICND